MKPIHLSLAGLQSYREKQEIDFTRLCDAGVFGIFGPTGSGKSSILDAITLALFGKVERASNGTQGILNHAEKALAVSFEFELTNAGGPQRYRVERQFKRSADNSVAGTVCRLIEVAKEGSVVLADKAGDVNSRIQELLGLSMQDFTRAVVLPQGKFAEFLSLTGKDRRQMLQRLFHLETYGDQLSARLSQRFKKADSALKQTTARLEGLGDASHAAVKMAEESLLEADVRSRSMREKRLEAEREWEKLKQVLTWQQELAALSERQASQDELQPVMAERESRLKKADKASRIRPYLDEWEAAGRLQKECGGREELLRKEREATEGLAGAADQAFALAQSDLSANDAALQVKLEQLNQALALQADIRLSEENLRARAAFRSSQARLLTECTDRLSKEQEIHAKAVNKQAELKTQQNENEVKAELRHKLFAASVGLRQMDELERQLSDMDRECREQEQLCQTHETEAKSAETHLHSVYVRLKAMHTEGEEWASRLLSLEDGRSSLLETLQRGADELTRSRREQDHARLAAQLAKDLAADHPCPVCGSAQHPAPALFDGIESDEDNREAESYGQLAADAQERIFFLRQQGFVLQNSLEKLSAAISDPDRQFPQEISVSEAEAAASLSIPNGEAKISYAGEFSFENLAGPVTAAGMEQVFRKLEPFEQAAEEFVREFERRMQQLSEQHRQAVSACHKTSAQLQSALTVHQSLLEKRIQLRGRMEEAHARWKAEYNEWTPESVTVELDRLSEKDKILEELKIRLDKSIEFLEQKQESISALKQQTVECEKELLKADTEIEGLNRAIAEKRKQIAERSGGGEDTVEGQIQTVTVQLQGLRDRERETRERREKRQAELQDVSHRHTAAKQACTSADSALRKAEANWLDALANTEFTNAGEVLEAHLSDEIVRNWEQELRVYQDKSAELKAGLQQLRDKLDGRSVSEPARGAAENKLLEAKKLDEEALEQRARAHRDLEELQTKHRIWLDLEKEKEAFQEACGNLSRLQQVFRGNAFVEFLAEEQLLQVSRSASERLGQLTRQRYALEVDSQGGFIIRDDANGGIRRPVSSLSGGETFLTSLALALALSSQIQLSGKYPLEFFFMDEGFGTLDPDLLETVVCALEKLHLDRLTVGVISHVPELKARLPRRLVVEPAEPTGRGSRILLESV